MRYLWLFAEIFTISALTIEPRKFFKRKNIEEGLNFDNTDLIFYSENIILNFQILILKMFAKP